MTDYCSYHPQEHACGYCETCARRYCRQCLGGTDSAATRFCPRCRRPLSRHTGAAEDDLLLAQTQPFFAWPFQIQPFLTILMATLIALVLPQTLAGAIIAGILLLILMAYGFAAIRSLQSGATQPPTIARLWSETEYDRVSLLLAVVALMIGLTVGAYWLAGLWLAIPVTLFLAISLPASIAVIAEDGGVLDALNPKRLATPMLELGWSYVVLGTHLVLMLFGVVVLVDFLLSYAPRTLAHPASGFISSYLLLVFCAMMGQLLHQRRSEQSAQDADTPAEPARPLTHASTPSERRQHDTDILIALKEGDYDRAQTLLVQALKNQPGNNDYAGRLFRLLDARADAAGLAHHHSLVFPWLIREQDASALLRCLRRLYAWEPEFELASPDLTFQCAQVLYGNESYRSVYRLLRGFHTRFPDYPDTARVYVLLARTLANGLGEHHKAQQLLEFVQSSYRDHPVQERIPDYLSQLAAGQPLQS